MGLGFEVSEYSGQDEIRPLKEEWMLKLWDNIYLYLTREEEKPSSSVCAVKGFTAVAKGRVLIINSQQSLVL